MPRARIAHGEHQIDNGHSCSSTQRCHGLSVSECVTQEWRDGGRGGAQRASKHAPLAAAASAAGPCCRRPPAPAWPCSNTPDPYAAAYRTGGNAASNCAQSTLPPRPPAAVASAAADALVHPRQLWQETVSHARAQPHFTHRVAIKDAHGRQLPRQGAAARARPRLDRITREAVFWLTGVCSSFDEMQMTDLPACRVDGCR